MSWRERVAHAATPEDWRSRASVVVLVCFMAALMVFGAVSIIIDKSDRAAVALNVAFGELVLYLMLLRPALRSLRKWDASHSEAV